MKQYLDLCRRIVNEGEWVANERTGKRCLTVINADLEYDVANNQFPLITTRKSYWKAAIAEFLGYIRGYDNAADFRKLGTKTWDANANENAAWLANPHRKGTDDMGRVYGVQGRAWRKPNGETISHRIFEQDSVFSAHPISDHDRYRGCKFKRTRIIDDEQGHSVR